MRREREGKGSAEGVTLQGAAKVRGGSGFRRYTCSCAAACRLLLTLLPPPLATTSTRSSALTFCRMRVLVPLLAACQTAHERKMQESGDSGE